MTKITRQKPTASELRKVSFGIADSKGRALGSNAVCETIEFVAAPEGAMTWMVAGEHKDSPEIGINYSFRPEATRGGKSFGAWKPARYFRTAAERDAAVEAYFLAAEKRAAKNAA